MNQQSAVGYSTTHATCTSCGTWYPMGSQHSCYQHYGVPNQIPYSYTYTTSPTLEQIRQVIKEELAASDRIHGCGCSKKRDSVG